MIDLNKLKVDAAPLSERDLERLTENRKTHEDYLALPPEELARIAEENEMTPEKFLENIKRMEEIRRAAKGG